jgi:hypothetical protein
MRYLVLVGILFIGCVWAADDEADYKAFKEAQEQVQKDARELQQRDAEVKQLEDDVATLKARYKGLTIDAALAKWREDIRKISDPVQRWSQYEWMARVEKLAKATKERTKIETTEDAITTEKADIQAKK